MTTMTDTQRAALHDLGEQMLDTRPVGKRGVAILKELAALSVQEKAIKAKKEALKAEFEDIAQGAKFGTFQGAIVATRIDSHSVKTDYKMLAEAFPEAFEATVTKTPYHYYKG